MNKYQKKKVSNSKTPFYYYKVDSKGKKTRVSKEEYQMKGGNPTNISNIDSSDKFKLYMDKAKYYTSGVFKGKKLVRSDLSEILSKENKSIIWFILKILNDNNILISSIDIPSFENIVSIINTNSKQKDGKKTIKEIIEIINREIDYYFTKNESKNKNFDDLITKIAIIEGILKHIKYLAIKNI